MNKDYVPRLLDDGEIMQKGDYMILNNHGYKQLVDIDPSEYNTTVRNGIVFRNVPKLYPTPLPDKNLSDLIGLKLAMKKVKENFYKIYEFHFQHWPNSDICIRFHDLKKILDDIK